jgi:glycosyltransferase involved in cell wall biosynthesis
MYFDEFQSRLKILIITGVFPPESLVSAWMSYDLAIGLSKNANVVVLSPYPSRIADSNNSIDINYSNNTFKHIYLKSYVYPRPKPIGRLLESISLGLVSYRFIKNNRNKFDIIYQNVPPLFAQYFIAKSSQKYKIPLVTHIQDIYPESFAERLTKPIKSIILGIFLPIDRVVLRKSKLIVVNSEKMKYYLSKTRLVSQNKIKIVRNWQDDNAFSKNILSVKGQNNRPFVFMYLGSINLNSSVELFIKSFINARLSNAELIIAGDGSYKKRCENIVNQMNAKNITFISAPKSSVPLLQEKSDVLLLALPKGTGKFATPSKFTAYALSGKPILAAIDKDSDIGNLIIQNNCGFVTEPNNKEMLSKMMKKIFKMNKNELIELGKNAKILAKKRLSKEINQNILENIILSAAKKNYRFFTHSN